MIGEGVGHHVPVPGQAKGRKRPEARVDTRHEDDEANRQRDQGGHGEGEENAERPQGCYREDRDRQPQNVVDEGFLKDIGGLFLAARKELSTTGAGAIATVNAGNMAA